MAYPTTHDHARTHRTWSTLATAILMIALLDFVLHLIRAVIAGRIFDAILDGHFAPNSAQLYLVLFCLISGVVGMATAIVSMDHARVWNEISRRSAWSVNMISFLLTILAAAVAIKFYTYSDAPAHDRKTETIGALSLVQIVTLFIHLMLLRILKRHQVVLVDVARPVDPTIPAGRPATGTTTAQYA